MSDAPRPPAVSDLDPEDRAAYEALYASIDSRGWGAITVEEMDDWLSRFGLNPSAVRLCELARRLGVEDCDSIGFEQFVQLLLAGGPELPDPVARLRREFAEHDRNGDGHISPDEFAAAMGKLGVDLSPHDIEEMIREADLDGDGVIDFIEFVKMHFAR